MDASELALLKDPAARELMRQLSLDNSRAEAEAVADFIKFFRECCQKKPELFVASENPARDIAFIDCERHHPC